MRGSLRGSASFSSTGALRNLGLTLGFLTGTAVTSVAIFAIKFAAKFAAVFGATLASVFAVAFLAVFFATSGVPLLALSVRLALGGGSSCAGRPGVLVIVLAPAFALGCAGLASWGAGAAGLTAGADFLTGMTGSTGSTGSIPRPCGAVKPSVFSGVADTGSLVFFMADRALRSGSSAGLANCGWGGPNCAECLGVWRPRSLASLH